MDIELLITEEESGAQHSVVLELEERAVIGRDADCDVSLSSKGISRTHVALESEGGRLYVTDLSNNGTWLDGVKLNRNQRRQVQGSGTLTIPGYRIQLQIPVPSMHAMPAAAVGSVIPAGPVSSVLTSFSRFEIVMVVSAIGSFVLAWYELSF